MSSENSFPVLVHLITVPMTLGFGFVLGWVLRSALEKRRPRPPGEPRAA